MTLGGHLTVTLLVTGENLMKLCKCIHTNSFPPEGMQLQVCPVYKKNRTD